jgi:small GTP-binding protein
MFSHFDMRKAVESAGKTGQFTVQGAEGERFPESIRRVKYLRAISLIDCHMVLPYWMREFSRLESLHIVNNDHRINPDEIDSLIEIDHLHSLRNLTLSGFEDLSLEIELAQLINLRTLVLSDNKCLSIRLGMSGLTRLEMLDISACRLDKVPNNAEALTSLQYLLAWGNNFRKIPQELRACRQLRYLDLSRAGQSHRLSADRPNIGVGYPVTSEFLPISRKLGGEGAWGSIDELPSWIAEAWPDMSHLYLGGNRITEIPRWIGALWQLEVISLPENQVSTLPNTISSLRRLMTLDLRNNQIYSIPGVMRSMSWLRQLGLADNPIGLPPEIAQDSEASKVLAFVANLLKGSAALNEAKLIVVGEGAVGKSSLVRRLVSNEFNSQEEKTQGIDVARWSLGGPRTVDLSVWDFGGQEIMHATHQFFMTRRSLYILAIDNRQDEEQNRVEYWLKLIAGFSDGSPVIVVGNKMDESPLDIDQRGLVKKYPNVLDIRSVSCMNGAGIVELKALITERVGQLPHVSDPMPAGYLGMKRELEALKSDYISFSHYQDMCRKHGISTLDAQENLVSLLHDLGTVLCFRDDPRLTDTSILNPTWVTGGVYRILNSHRAAQLRGLLTWKDIEEILDDPRYPKDRRFFIVDMMKKFELCYEADSVLLVPDLLTKEEPDTGDWTGALHFEVRYDVLPSSMLSRLTVRMHKRISRSTVWRNGFVASLDNNRALVRSDKEEGLILIDVLGQKSTRRSLLAAIRSELHEIQISIPGLIAEERVPIPEHPGLWVPYTHLLSLEGAGRARVTPVGMVREVFIRDLLEGIEEPLATASRTQESDVRNGDVEQDETLQLDGAPWTPADALRFAALLIVCALMSVLALGGLFLLAGATGLAFGGLALVPVVLVGVLTMRAAGRIGEKTFLNAVRLSFQRVGSSAEADTTASRDDRADQDTA